LRERRNEMNNECPECGMEAINIFSTFEKEEVLYIINGKEEKDWSRKEILNYECSCGNVWKY
jgi:hypothetical protein